MPGVSPVVFETAGKRTEHVIPGVYTRKNNVPSGTGTVSMNLVVLGQSIGGKPRELIQLADVSEARNALVGGSLLDGVAHAFNGSTDFVPQKVFAFRVNNGTRSSITLVSGTDDILTLKSRDYGVHTNQIKIWVKDGTAPGSKKAVVSYKGNEVDTGDILKKSFSILYTGAGTTASMSITTTGITLTSSAGQDLAVSWEECETIDDLVSRINDTGKYTATVIDVTPNAKTAELDTVETVSVHGTAAIAYSNLQAFIKALRGIQFIGSVELVSTTVRVFPENNTGYEYFSEAVAGTYNITDWIDSLEKLEEENVQCLTTPCDDHDAQVLIVNHCVGMSTTEKRKERQYLLGAPLGISLEEGLALSAEFNTELGSLVIDSAVANNPLTGSTETISPALLACKAAGMEAAMGIANPLTNKQVKVNSFGVKRSAGDIGKMITGGIMPFGVNEDGLLVVIRAMTNFQDDNLASNERSCVREALYMDRDFRKAYARRIGNADEPSESDIVDILKKRAKIWYRFGMITKSDSGDLVFDINVRFDGDATFIEYSRYLRTPNNFIFGTANNKIYRTPEAE
jgi:hypothetical protein